MASLDGFGLRGMAAGINAMGALLSIGKISYANRSHIREVQTYTTSQYLSLDKISQRNLELTESFQDGSRKNTLLDILDKTCTPMGASLMRHWIKQPLLSVTSICQRQDAVELFSQSRKRLRESVVFWKMRDLNGS